MITEGKVLVTGASGFLGSSLCTCLIRSKSVRAAVREPISCSLPSEVEVVSCELSPRFSWISLLENVSTVVHCAARVHVMNDVTANPLEEFRCINVEGTLHLARQAAKVGVRRFLFISSIGVNGGETFGYPFLADAPVAPHSPYALSKHEAEVGLRELAIATGMEVVVIRPPLIYGPNAPGNFLSLMNLMDSGFPLPLGAVTGNRRSLVALDNIVNLIITCIDHPAAANQTFLVADGENLSTADLLRRMGNALGQPARLIYVPVSLLKFGAFLLCKREIAKRLCGSLEIDISKTKELLGWVPSISIDEALRQTAEHWLASKCKKSDRKIQMFNLFPMKRLFDLLMVLFVLAALALPILLIAILVRLTSSGPSLYWSDRVGKDNAIFRMPKFRSMRVGTPVVATHVLRDPAVYLTPIGSFLRKSSLDELPQLWSILVGHMSFVGPRPALFNQEDLITLRTQYGVDALMPGLTGWAQVNGRDELSIPIKVQYEVEYLQRQSFWFDMKILGLTFLKVVRRAGVSH